MAELSNLPAAHPKRASSLFSDDSDYPDPEKNNFPDGTRPNSLAPLSQHQEQRFRPDSYNLPGSVFMINSNGRVLNLPIPSESPCDPLNWTWQKRALALFAIGLFDFVSGVTVGATNACLIGMFIEFPSSKTKPFSIDQLSAVTQLFMALGGIFWAPLSLAIGRKQVLVYACLFRLVGVGLVAYSNSFYSILTGICILGFAHGFALTLGFLIVIDLTFIHQRPNALALVWSGVGCCSSIVIGTIPYIIGDLTHWRRIYHVWVLPCFISLLVSLFCFAETYFKRPSVAFDGGILIQSATEKLTLIYHDDDTASVTNLKRHKELPSAPLRSRVARYWDEYGLRRAPATSFTAMKHIYFQCLYCVFNPMICWVILLMATNWTGLIFIGVHLAISPPNESTGLHPGLGSNLCAAAGLLLSWPIGGPLVWAIMKQLAKHNKGVREAEHYLIGFVIPVIIGAMGTLLYTFAVQREWPFGWMWFAYGLVTFSFGSVQINNSLWVTEAFPRWATSALMVVNGGSFFASAGATLGMFTWITSYGVLNVGTVASALQVFVGLFVMPIAFWGKQGRQKLNGKYEGAREGALRPQ